MSVRDIDRGARVLLARLRGLKEGVRVTVGVHPDAAAKPHPSSNTVGEVASILEIGTNKQAPIGFLRTTIETERGTLAKQLAAAGEQVLKGEDHADAFGPKVRAKVPVDTRTVRDAVEARVNDRRVG